MLRPALTESVRRARERSGYGLRDSAPIRDLHRQFGELGALEANVIDTTSLSPEQTAAQVKAIIMSGQARLSPA